MHISVRLPKIEPTAIQPSPQCPLKNRKTKRRCTGTHFKLHQAHCQKPVRDLRHHQVVSQRYRCLKCQRTFRVYPPGVCQDQLSATLKALTVLLYVLGLSYQGVADLCESLLHPISKTAVYNNVQAAGKKARRLRKSWLGQQKGKVKVLGLDFTHVKCNGKEVILAVATAILTGQPLTFDMAARVDLAPSDYIARLAGHRLARLVSEDDPEQNVERVFDLSYGQLSPEMQACFRALAVFPAPFDSPAAAAVLALEPQPARDLLGDLVRFSLVEYDVPPSPAAGEGGVGGEGASGRYRLHDLLREFANARLTPDERFAAQQRHAEHYLEVASAANGLYRK
jgi:hypothetical protein